MPHSSITNSREPRTATSPRSVEALLRCTELLGAERRPEGVAQVLADQAHRNFFPAPAAVLSFTGAEFQLMATASQFERFGRALEGHLGRKNSFTDALLDSVESGRPTLHRLDSECEPELEWLRLAYCSPIRGSQPAFLALFLNGDKRLARDECTFFDALAEMGALALGSMADCPRNSAADIELVQPIAARGPDALQNLQLFTRITRASRQWAEIFDSISDLILLHDDLQGVVRVNRSLAGKLNKQPADILGARVSELFASSSGSSACPFCCDLSAQEFRDEFRDAKTGSTYLVSSSRLGRLSEEASHIVHVLKDVTASRRVERLYRELFDNIQEGAYFSAPDGRLLEVNDALVRMLGYDSREELLSVAASDLYVDPAHREITKRALHQFGRLRNHEQALLRRDRSIIYVLENSFVVRDEAGQVVEYRGVLLDITEIKHVQSQLLREHDFNTQILNHTQSLIAVVDTAGLVSYANRRCYQVAAVGEGDLVGSRLDTIVLPSHRSVLHGALECALDGKAVSNVELPLARGREAIGSFSVNLSPMRSASGEVNSVVAVMTDITDVAMLQAKLMHAEKMVAVGQLVSGVAHEVNNPLTAILGFADLLLENPELPAALRDDLYIIVQESQRTREIVQNLLSFARQSPPEKQLVDVNQVLRRTIALRSYDMGSHGIELLEHFDSRLSRIVGDAHQLQQVFLNILNNACDSVRETDRRGKIVVSTQQTGGSVEIRFQDNGTGISNADRIFDPFYTTKEVGKGTGLGLSICYGIVREHSGEILCWNNHESVGATFAIRLPLVQTSGKMLAARAAVAN